MPLPKLSPTLRGMLMMTIAMMFFSLMNNFVRQASLEMHSTQIALFRNVFTMLLMTSYLLIKNKQWNFAKTKKMRGHVLRATLGIFAVESWFYGLSQMPLNEATALSFTAPVFVTLFAIVLLKEKANLARWGAILLGFAGAMIILKPEPGSFNTVALVVLGSAALMAAGTILIKTMTKTENPDVIVFYQGALMTPLSIPFAVAFWQPIGMEAVFWAFMVALCSTVAHLFMTRAFALGEMVVLAPFDFTRLIFTAVLAYFWFGETLDIWTAVGGACIVFGSVWGAASSNAEVQRRMRRIFTWGMRE